MAFHPNSQLRLLDKGIASPLDLLESALIQHKPWDSIIDFACHPSYCGYTLYPRQATLLKLIFLETHNMTDYDLEVIEGWRESFGNLEQRNTYGVQQDIWKRVEYLQARGYRRFPHIQFVLGRRASKGYMSAITMAEQIAYLISLDNPQHHYGIREGKDVFCNIGGTSQTQAQQQLFADVRAAIEQCAYLQPHIAESKDHQMRLRTPADMRRIAQMASSGVPIEHLIASLWIKALSATSVAGRGPTSYTCAYDEFAFHISGTGSNKTGDSIYEDWQPSLGQFHKDALTLVVSSPATKTGKFYELYQTGRLLMDAYNDTLGVTDETRLSMQSMREAMGEDRIELNADPTHFIFQGPSWALYEDWNRGPQLVGVKFTNVPEPDLSDEAQQRNKRRNPDKFRVEREGQFAEVMGQYLDPAKVDAMFAPVPWRDPAVLTPTAFGRLDYAYRIHVDPSKTGANFGLAIGHVEMAPPDEWGESWPHVIIDRLHVWQAKDFPVNPETDRPEIDYTVIERELDLILQTFPSTTKFSADQWSSIGFLQRLRKKYSPQIRIVEDTATEKANYIRAERFKSALNLGWIHAPKDTLFEGGLSLLELECKFLSEHNGKVVKQDIGPVQTKDLWDATSVVATDLLKDALERWETSRLGAHAFGSTNISGLRAGHEFERLAQSGLSTRGIYTDGFGKSPDQIRNRTPENTNVELDRMRGKRTDQGYGNPRRRSSSPTEWARGNRWHS